MSDYSLGFEYEALGKTLREVRERAKVTQVELAERLNQTQSHLSKCERGGIRLDFVQVRRICLTLGVGFPEFTKKYERNLAKNNKK
jgi:transcriptional regulator with XRE-family HTH domain